MSKVYTLTLSERELQVAQDALVATMTVIHPEMIAKAPTAEVRRTVDGWFIDINNLVGRLNDLKDTDETVKELGA